MCKERNFFTTILNTLCRVFPPFMKSAGAVTYLSLFHSGLRHDARLQIACDTGQDKEKTERINVQYCKQLLQILEDIKKLFQLVTY